MAIFWFDLNRKYFQINFMVSKMVIFRSFLASILGSLVMALCINGIFIRRVFTHLAKNSLGVEKG